jgi:hypothetical protein
MPSRTRSCISSASYRALPQTPNPGGTRAFRSMTSRPCERGSSRKVSRPATTTGISPAGIGSSLSIRSGTPWSSSSSMRTTGSRSARLNERGEARRGEPGSIRRRRGRRRRGGICRRGAPVRIRTTLSPPARGRSGCPRQPPRRDARRVAPPRDPGLGLGKGSTPIWRTAHACPTRDPAPSSLRGFPNP